MSDLPLISNDVLFLLDGQQLKFELFTLKLQERNSRLVVKKFHPCILITGGRRSGKTSLAKNLLGIFGAINPSSRVAIFEEVQNFNFCGPAHRISQEIEKCVIGHWDGIIVTSNEIDAKIEMDGQEEICNPFKNILNSFDYFFLKSNANDQLSKIHKAFIADFWPKVTLEDFEMIYNHFTQDYGSLVIDLATIRSRDPTFTKNVCHRLSRTDQLHILADHLKCYFH